MAAPGEAYEGSLLMGSVPYALRLLEYDDDMKLLFHLDALLCTGDDPATAPFIGLIINNPLSVNYQYHAAARRFNATIEIDGVDYIVLNDGGLNTLGSCSVGVLSATVNAGLIIPITYRNAYYVDSDGIKVKYRKNGSPTWIEYFVKSSSPEKELATFNAFLTSVSGDLIPNDLVYVKVQNINAEGIFESAESSLTLPFPSLVMAYDGANASTAYGNFGSNTAKATRYFSTYELIIGTAIYGNSTGYITLPAGYYASLDFWIKVEMNTDPEPKSVITKIGAIGTWDTGDPATPSGYGTYEFFHFDSPTSRWATTCAFLSGGSNTPKTLYINYIDNKWYTTTGLTTLASDGNYYLDASTFVVMNSGVNIGEGNCIDGPLLSEE